MTTQADTSDQVRVYLELGTKRVFACALDWPGWCRSAKTEEAALAALAGYAERYAVVARAAGLAFPYSHATPFEVVERLPGSAGYTDFGAPGAVAMGDRVALNAPDAARHTALLKAAWRVLDRVAASAPPELRKGPRGGGRDRDQVIAHVLGAETAYARKLGITQRQPAQDDAPAVAALRAAITHALHSAPADAATGWPPRYAVRRIAWHVLDHAWEMEDRREPAG